MPLLEVQRQSLIKSQATLNVTEGSKAVSALNMKMDFALDVEQIALELPRQKQQLLNWLKPVINSTSSSDLEVFSAQLAQIKLMNKDAGDYALRSMQLMSDAHLESNSFDRIYWLANLRRGGNHKLDERRAAMVRIYKATRLDPSFVSEDKKMRVKVLYRLHGDPLLKKASRDWNKMTDNERMSILQRALTIQCEVMNIAKQDMPTITLVPGLVWRGANNQIITSAGRFDSRTNTIEINKGIDKGGVFNRFDDVLDTLIHENTHNYQHKLVARLTSPPPLFPGDPLYAQARLFQLNLGGIGYIDGGDGYMEQPVERHAWEAGGEAAKLFLEDAKIGAQQLLDMMQQWLKTRPKGNDQVSKYCGIIAASLKNDESTIVIFRKVNDYNLMFTRVVKGQQLTTTIGNYIDSKKDLDEELKKEARQLIYKIEKLMEKPAGDGFDTDLKHCHFLFGLLLGIA